MDENTRDTDFLHFKRTGKFLNPAHVHNYPSPSQPLLLIHKAITYFPWMREIHLCGQVRLSHQVIISKNIFFHHCYGKTAFSENFFSLYPKQCVCFLNNQWALLALKYLKKQRSSYIKTNVQSFLPLSSERKRESWMNLQLLKTLRLHTAIPQSLTFYQCNALVKMVLNRTALKTRSPNLVIIVSTMGKARWKQPSGLGRVWS